MAAICDATSLYDNLIREQFTGADRRSALEICVIRDSLKSLDGRVRWIPHEENPVDTRTKIKGNSARLLEMMKTARFRLTCEVEEMERRKQYREETGKKHPRPNVTKLSNLASKDVHTPKNFWLPNLFRRT